jgi:Ca-activated chloride channel family protein
MKTAAFVFAALAVQTAQFRVGVDAVRVDALVMDSGKPVVGLGAEDFEVRDSGVVQTIESVAIADVPISMMIALDTSESVSGRTLQELKDGVSAAVAALQPTDRAALIAFSTDVRLKIDWGQDHASLVDAVSRLRAGGGTALWDATFAALTFSDDTPAVRRLVLVFSDGEDTSSWLPWTAVIEKARRGDAVVYAIEIKNASAPRARTLQNRSGVWTTYKDTSSREQAFLDELSEISGGAAYTIADAGELRKAFARVLTEFRTRYLITYMPRGVDQPGWHPLEVTLKTQRGEISARRGYVR